MARDDAMARARAASGRGRAGLAARARALPAPVLAGLLAAVTSGTPSSLVALVRGEDVLDGARAAGAMVLPRETRTVPLLAAAMPVHLALSVG